MDNHGKTEHENHLLTAWYTHSVQGRVFAFISSSVLSLRSNFFGPGTLIEAPNTFLVYDFESEPLIIKSTVYTSSKQGRVAMTGQGKVQAFSTNVPYKSIKMPKQPRDECGRSLTKFGIKLDSKITRASLWSFGSTTRYQAAAGPYLSLVCTTVWPVKIFWLGDQESLWFWFLFSCSSNNKSNDSVLETQCFRQASDILFNPQFVNWQASKKVLFSTQELGCRHKKSDKASHMLLIFQTSLVWLSLSEQSIFPVHTGSRWVPTTAVPHNFGWMLLLFTSYGIVLKLLLEAFFTQTQYSTYNNQLCYWEVERIVSSST